MSAGLTPDQRARAAQWVPMASKIARVLAAVHDVDFYHDILRSTALEALTRTARRYDPARGVPFPSYAWSRISGAVWDAIKKEKRSPGFLAAVEAAEDIEDRSGWEDTDEAIVGQLDGIAAELMEVFFMSSAGEEHRRNGEARLLQREAAARVNAGVARLDPEDRRLVELRYWQDLPWKEVAQHLGTPLRTVKDHDRKIRGRLEAELRAAEADGRPPPVADSPWSSSNPGIPVTLTGRGSSPRCPARRRDAAPP
jgi:RNA polymerase sigma factor for flagellar operon FliA